MLYVVSAAFHERRIEEAEETVAIKLQDGTVTSCVCRDVHMKLDGQLRHCGKVVSEDMMML